MKSNNNGIFIPYEVLHALGYDKDNVKLSNAKNTTKQKNVKVETRIPIELKERIVQIKAKTGMTYSQMLSDGLYLWLNNYQYESFGFDKSKAEQHH